MSRVRNFPCSALLPSMRHFRTCTQRFCLCPVDFRRLDIYSTDTNRPMHLRLLPEKGKYKFRGVKMEMLVTKFSNGKYRNEGDLFAEPISADNVKLMGE